MSDVSERIKKRIKKEFERLSLAINGTDKFTKQGISDCIKELRDSSIEIINEELAKEPQECKWFKYDYRTIAPKHHDVENPYWRIPENMDKLKYCPYCGRKIKVIEDD